MDFLQLLAHAQFSMNIFLQRWWFIDKLKGTYVGFYDNSYKSYFRFCLINDVINKSLLLKLKSQPFAILTLLKISTDITKIPMIFSILYVHYIIQIFWVLWRITIWKYSECCHDQCGFRCSAVNFLDKTCFVWYEKFAK